MKYQWLNEDSRKFLERGYLQKGQSAEQRINEIAQNAEKILGIEGFAEKFEEYMSKGWFSLSSPVWANFGTNRGLPISCVTGDTWIITQNGGKKAKDIKEGDLLLTHLNRFRPVTQVIKTKDKNDIWKLKLDDVDDTLFITGNHQVLTNQGWIRIEDLNFESHEVAVNMKLYSDDYDSLLYSPIKTLERTDKIEDVYDFTVEEDHSFSCAGVVVHNCFGIELQDQTDDILRGVSEIGMMTKMGGGTAGFFGQLRGRGDAISSGGESNGTVSFMKMYDTMMDIISQGAVRRGSFAAYLPVDHKDIHEFLRIREIDSGIQNLSFAVTVPEGWMQSMIDGDKEKREIWAKVLKRRSESGYPYILFEDNVNNNKPQVYKDKDMKIKTSQLCVSGDQMVRSQFGDTTVEELYQKGEELFLFDGFKIVKASKMKKTGESKQTFTFHLANGFSHTVTADHKVSTTRGLVQYKNLRLGDKVHCVQNMPDVERFNKDEIGQLSLFLPETSEIVKFEMNEVQDVYCVTVDSSEHLWVCNGIVTSNCSEILEYTSDEKSFTCCLSSINLLHYDEWKDTDAIEVLTYFLDAVLTDFIDKAKGIAYFEKAVKFAEEHRSIGLGVLGWHSYLQSKMIPFESMGAKFLNVAVFKNINEKSLKASKELAELFGEPKMLEGYGERFTTRLAIAPTTSSSFILGQVSPSIEPLHSNYFIKDLAKGKFSVKNPFLIEILKQKGKNTPEVWKSIMMKGGSVQHLEFLTENEKMVFKTFGEISQKEVVLQAAQRQKFIDQGQSLNLMIHPEAEVKEINQLMIEAWKLGIKTLYYQRSANVAQEIGRSLNECVSCEG